jgi:outer membrane protein assembly factor BamB
LKNKIFITVLFALAFYIVNAQVESQWRGTNRDGIYFENNLLKEWPEEGLKLLWSFDKLGKGFSSPCVTKDRIFISTEKDSTGTAYAFDLAGNLLWESVYGKEWNASFPGVRSTFICYNNKLYLMTSFMVAICLDAKTGNKIWEADLKEKFGATVEMFGGNESPIVYNNKVIFTPGGTIAAMVALDPDNGNVIWQSAGINDNSSYCSPQLIEHNGKKQIVNAFRDSLASFDADNGTFLWAFTQKNKYGNHCNTPIYRNGYLYSTTGYGTGGIMLKIADDGKSVNQVWRDSLLDNLLGGIVYYNNMIAGSGHTNKAWYALGWETGKVKYTTKVIGPGSVVFADDHFYCYSDKGGLGLMKLTDKGFELVSSMKITLGDYQHWAHPVISNGVLYLHHGNTLMAYSLK